MRLFKIIPFVLVLFITTCTKYDCPPTISKPTESCPAVADYEFTGNTNDASSYAIIAADSGATLCADRFGNANSAYNFNGVNSYINGGTNNRGVTSTVTVSAWIQTTSANYGSFIISKYNYTEDHGYCLTILNNKAQFEGRDGSNIFWQSGISSTTVTDGNWHLITGVVRNSTWEIWVDGVLENSITSTNSNPKLATSAPLVVGYYSENQSSYFEGRIDDVKLWNCALDSAYIAYMYSKPPVMDSVTISGSAIISSEVRLESPATNLSATSCLSVWTTEVTANLPILGLTDIPDIGRSFMQFNYSQVPSGANIVSATLYLYIDTTQVIAGNIKGATQISGPNNWVINTLTSPWNTSTVTWNNQPSYDLTYSINIPATNSPPQNYAVDITSIVQTEISNPSSNYGIVMLLAKETLLDTIGLAFYNNNGPVGLQPKLVIKYK